jgi:coenzyme Q-binding protein COQ10
MRMKTLRPLTSSLLHRTLRQRPHHQCRLNPYPRPSNHNRQTRRTFLSNPLSSEPQSLTASRTLPYPSAAIFAVISDVSSYANFLPYCRSSVVTKQSEPTAYDGKRYPEEAKLVVGFSHDIAEEFWSRVYCSPARGVVEAVAGASETTQYAADIEHHHARPSEEEDKTRTGDVLSHLSTRWSMRSYPYKPPPVSAVDKGNQHKNHEESSPVPGLERTEVNLTIQFRFANPMYGALSQAAAPKVAEKMIEAFEARVRKIVEGQGHE